MCHIMIIVKRCETRVLAFDKYDYDVFTLECYRINLAFWKQLGIPRNKHSFRFFIEVGNFDRYITEIFSDMDWLK